MVSCTKHLEDLNVITKSPQDVSYTTLFSAAELRLVNQLTDADENYNVFRLQSQYWTETTYVDEANYNLNSRAIPDHIWAALYRDVLQDLERAKSLLPASADPTSATSKNQLAIIDVLEVFTYSTLVNIYGNIPYSKALDINNVMPTYDDAATIYADLFTRLDADIAALSTSGEGFGSIDLIYGTTDAKLSNQVELWKKFANSLKLRMALTVADVDGTAGQKAAEAAAGVFTSAADNASFAYSTIPPNTNPVWVALVQSGRHDFIGTNTLVDILNALNDPRLPQFFTTVPGSDPAVYAGAPYGVKSVFTDWSGPSPKVEVKDREALVLDYSEVEFYLAEAAARGYAVGGTPASHYNAGIKASILYWGGTEDDYAAYVAQPSVAYATASVPNGWKGAIGTQSWIAHYNRGYEGWLSWRTLDFPLFNVPPNVDDYADIPVRYTYPVTEQNLNKTNYNAAAAAIGGDALSTKLFWDKF